MPDLYSSKIISGDINDVKFIKNTIEGADAVIYCIGIIREFPRKGITFEKLHFQAAKECIDVAKASDVKRFIIPINNFHVPRKLFSIFKKTKYKHFTISKIT